MKDRIQGFHNDKGRALIWWKRGVSILSALFLLTFYGTSFAQDPDGQKNNLLVGVISKLERMKDDAAEKIQKCEKTIQESQDIIRRAQHAGNSKAEMIAMQALTKAQDAKRKAEWVKTRATEGIEKINIMLESASKSEADVKAIEEAKSLLQKILNRDASLCSEIESQLEKDKAAIRRYQKIIEMSNKELQKWEEKNKKAEHDAFRTGMTALLGGAGKKLLENKKIADHIQQRLTEYQVKIAVEGPPKQKLLMDRLIKKMVGASYSYAQASAKADTGKFIEVGLDIKNKYDAAKAMVDSIQAANEVGHKEIKEVMQMLSDPENNLRSSFLDLFSLGAEERLETILEETPFLNNLASFTLFLRDYGYDATAWYQSRERILQFTKIQDEQLKAVEANKKQIEKTMQRLKECREGSVEMKGTKGGKTVIVNGGHRATATKEGVLSDPERIDLMAMHKWWEE